jgi:hypothetical protein
LIIHASEALRINQIAFDINGRHEARLVLIAQDRTLEQDSWAIDLINRVLESHDSFTQQLRHDRSRAQMTT